MCGIAGFYRQGNKKLTPDDVRQLLVTLQQRGTDATGMAWKIGNEVKVIKAPLKAEEFVNLPQFSQSVNEVCDAQWALFHTRQATHGSPKEDNNNHPIVNSKGLIIHNGMVSIAEEFTDAQGQTDTEQMLLCLQKYGFKGIARVYGSLAIAYVDFSRPDRFYLYAHTSPIAYSRSDNLFLFASTVNILKSVYQGVGFFVLPHNRVFRVNRPILHHIKKVVAGTVFPPQKYTPDWTSYVTPYVKKLLYGNDGCYNYEEDFSQYEGS